MSFREPFKRTTTGGRRRPARRTPLEWMRELMFEDWGLKLLALAITLGLWLAVTGQQQTTTRRLSKVHLAFLLPDDMAISNETRDTVEVTLSGSKSVLDGLDAHDLSVRAYLRNLGRGDRVARLIPSKVTMDLPDGVRIENIEPSSVPIKLERIVEREVEVKAHLEGNLGEGYEVGQVVVSPSRITVRGAESHVAKLESVPTETISLDGRTSDFTIGNVAIDIYDDKVTPLESIVKVGVQVRQSGR